MPLADVSAVEGSSSLARTIPCMSRQYRGTLPTQSDAC
jgi:hypothetical protein